MSQLFDALSICVAYEMEASHIAAADTARSRQSRQGLTPKNEKNSRSKEEARQDAHSYLRERDSFSVSVIVQIELPDRPTGYLASRLAVLEAAQENGTEVVQGLEMDHVFVRSKLMFEFIFTWWEQAFWENRHGLLSVASSSKTTVRLNYNHGVIRFCPLTVYNTQQSKALCQVSIENFMHSLPREPS